MPRNGGPDVRGWGAVPDVPDQADIAPATLAQALGHVESLPLGEAVILHNRESGAIVASNPFGAMLIDHLRAAPDVGAAARRIAADLEMPATELRATVEAIVARWVEDGLFLTAIRPFPLPVAYRPAENGAVQRLTLGTRVALMHSESAAFVDDIARALAPMGLATDGAAPGGAGVRIDVIADANGFGVFRDRAPIWGAAGYELTRFHVLREIMDILSGPERVSAHLHASAVALGGVGLVFAGASGSGKSTLATTLLGAGAALASDDHVAIDIDGEALFAFPTRPNLKPGAAEVPEVAAVIGGQGEGAFVPNKRVPAGAAVRLAGFVFPRYDPDGEDALTRIDPADALRRLIQTGSRVSRSTRSIAPLLHALRNHPTCVLSYRDTGFAVAQCRALLER